METGKCVQMSEKTLPLLDIGLWFENPRGFVEQLRHVCHTIGFFLLKYDKVMSTKVAERALKETKIFFDYPLEKKLSLSYENSPEFRGYMKLGVENTAGVVDIREQVEFATETDSSVAGWKLWPPYERLRGRNQWPDDFQPSLRPTIMEYVNGTLEIANIIRRALCMALGLSADALDHMFDNDPHWAMKLVSYPVPNENMSSSGANHSHSSEIEQSGLRSASELQSEPQTSSWQGVGAHTDTNFLTLVLQDSVGGLQVFSKDSWIDVPADGPAVLVCNLGEQAQILSSGYFLATPHRVVRRLVHSSTASLENNQSRISIPIFFNPNLEAKIQPLKLPENVMKTSGVSENKRHWRNSSDKNAMLEAVGYNTFKSLARSHPVVFRKHHGDLCILEDGRIVKKCFDSKHTD